MLRVVFNIEAGKYYNKSTFIMTLIKQEKLVFILVILYSTFGSIKYVFLQNISYPNISNLGYPK